MHRTLLEILFEAYRNQGHGSVEAARFVQFAQQWLDQHRPVQTFWAERNVGLRLRDEPGKPLLACVLCPQAPEPERQDTSVAVTGQPERAVPDSLPTGVTSPNPPAS